MLPAQGLFASTAGTRTMGLQLMESFSTSWTPTTRTLVISYRLLLDVRSHFAPSNLERVLSARRTSARERLPTSCRRWEIFASRKNFLANHSIKAVTSCTGSSRTQRTARSQAELSVLWKSFSGLNKSLDYTSLTFPRQPAPLRPPLSLYASTRRRQASAPRSPRTHPHPRPGR